MTSAKFLAPARLFARSKLDDVPLSNFDELAIERHSALIDRVEGSFSATKNLQAATSYAMSTRTGHS
jgi:hypothetical protein